jgi:hypothetical protein
MRWFRWKRRRYYRACTISFQSESGGKVSVKKVLQEVANNQAA